MNRRMDRRDFLKVGWLASLGPMFVRQPGLAGGRLLGTLPLGGQGAQPAPPFGQLLGSGLDARLFTDLSTLTPDTLVTPESSGVRIAVSGVDDLTQRSQTSVPGASWIFSRDDIERAAAFLATRMNGAPLPRDHGSPIRLVVPGWYGCACIKWVTQIDL